MKARYQSSGGEVAIVMADFFEKRPDEPLLKRVSLDALQLAGTLRR